MCMKTQNYSEAKILDKVEFTAKKKKTLNKTRKALCNDKCYKP